MRENSINLAVSKLGNGQYVIGERKISLKIVNKKLLVRMGAGYMSIDEFIECNPDLVLDKFDLMARMSQKQDKAPPKSTPLKR